MTDKNYNIEFVDVNKSSINVPPNVVIGPTGNTRKIDIDLTGLGSALWGEKVLENLTHILENFSCEEDLYDVKTYTTNTVVVDGDVRKSFILTGSPAQKSISIISSLNNDGTYIATNSTYDVPLNETTITITATLTAGVGDGLIGTPGVPKQTLPFSPITPTQGQLWYNQTVNQLNIWDGSWTSVGGMTVSTNQPTTASSGDFWWDISLAERQLKIYISGVWVRIVNDFLPRAGGMMVGNIDMAGNSITNSADPVALGDVVPFGYADNRYVKLAGDTMTGPLDMSTTQKIVGLADPALAQDAMNLQYADNNYLNLNGTIPMTASLNLNNNTITNIATPINGTDAANKDYVDAAIGTIINPWPIGSVYISIDAVNPSTKFGGSWLQIAQGRMLVGQDPGDILFDTAVNTGGSKNTPVVSHTHSTNNAGNHRHIGGRPTHELGSQYGHLIGPGVLESNTKHVVAQLHPYTDTTGNHVHGITSTGSSGTNKNLPPYYVTYMWERTG